MKHNYDPHIDASLVALVLAGEREAFGPLLLRYSQSVLRLCRQLLGPTPEAQDVAQEAALQAFLNLAQLQEPARFGAWLHAIAANLARMVLRRRRIVSLETLHAETPFVLLGAAAIPTPEEAYAAREIHDAVVQALEDLSAVNRDVVIGFFLDGYSYAELAELLGVPVSTVRGRLFQGRQQLRRSLSPLARENVMADRRSAPVRAKEITMEQPELVEMAIIGIQQAPFPAARPTYGVLLREPDTDLELRLLLREDEAGAIQHARGENWHAPPPALPPELMLRLLASLAVKVERVVIHSLVEAGLYTTVTLAQGEHRSETDVRLGEGLALASASSAPVYAERSILEAIGVNAGDALLEEYAKQQIRQRLAARVEDADMPVLPRPPLTPEVQQQVDELLARLGADVGAVNVVLMHQSGTVIAAQGPADKVALTHYSKALHIEAENPQDATELRRYRQLLTADIFTPEAWVLVWQWPDWLLQISGLPDTTLDPDHDPDTTRERLKLAAQELESLLSPPTSTRA